MNQMFKAKFKSEHIKHKNAYHDCPVTLRAEMTKWSQGGGKGVGALKDECKTNMSLTLFWEKKLVEILGCSKVKKFIPPSPSQFKYFKIIFP